MAVLYCRYIGIVVVVLVVLKQLYLLEIKSVSAATCFFSLICFVSHVLQYDYRAMSNCLTARMYVAISTVVRFIVSCA